MKEICIAIEPRELKERGQIETVDARDIHSYLGVGKNFSEWMKIQIEKAQLIENIDYCVLNSRSGIRKSGSGGHNRIDYFVTIEAGKMICMISGTEKGKNIRRYFIDCEMKLKELQKRISEMSDIERVENYIEQLKDYKKILEEKEALRLTIESNTLYPKTEPKDSIENRISLVRIRDEYFPFVSNPSKISFILSYYGAETGLFTNSKNMKKEMFEEKQLAEFAEVFVKESTHRISSTRKGIVVKHPSLLKQSINVRKDLAIDWFGYEEEDFEFDSEEEWMED
jgi:phage anti-repressor protein